MLSVQETRGDLVDRPATAATPNPPARETAAAGAAGAPGAAVEAVNYFGNGGAEEYYLASADAMKRNLEARVEVMCPVDDPELTGELRTVLGCVEADRRSAWDMQPDGSYLQRRPAAGESDQGTHQMLIARAEKRLKESLKRKKKPRSLASAS